MEYMKAKGMQLFIILTMLFLVSCGDLSGKKDKDEPLNLNQLASCTIDTKAFSQILSKDIKGDILCMQDNIHTFIDYVETDRPGSISQHYLNEFIRNGPRSLGGEETAPLVNSLFEFAHV